MAVRAALGEDLRRYGLILLTTAVVGGVMRDQVPATTAYFAFGVGSVLLLAGYWCHYYTGVDIDGGSSQ
jgi:hypothetical protein